MAIQSPLGIKGISQGIVETRKNVSASVATANSITKLVESRTKVSGDIFRRGSILRSRRLEASKRQEMEDEIEAGRLDVSTSQGATVVAQRGSGGFLGRIMQAIAALGVGWLLNNLPTWIAMGKEFIARIQRTGQILGGFVSNVISLLRGFGNVVGSLASNLSRFDLTDSSGKLQESFSELELTLGSMGDQLQEGFKMLMSPLSEGVASGENAPATGSEAPDTLYPDVDSRGGVGSGSSTGTKEQRAMLDAIAFAEGTRDQPNNGYKTLFGFGQFDDYSRHPDKVVRSGRYASAAAGRYQFMPGTFNRLAKKLGLKDFSPASQDKAAIELAREYGVTQELLAKEGMSPKVSALLGRQWASFPGKTIGLDQPTKKLKSVQQAYQKSLGSASPSAPSTNINVTGMPTPGVTTSVKDEFKGKSGGPAGIITSERGWRWGRMHHGIDIAPAGRGYYVALKLSGKVNLVAWDPGGYGNYVDIKSGNTIYRFAHLAKVMVKQNQSYNGQTIGEIGTTGGSTGIHLHFEVRPGGGNSINPRPYLGLLSIGKQLIGIAGKPETVQVPQLANAPAPPAQVSRSGQQSQAQRLASATAAPERKGEQIYLVNSGTTQQPMMMGSNQPSDVGIQISEFDLVNRFMKNKLLLDLAYL